MKLTQTAFLLSLFLFACGPGKEEIIRSEVEKSLTEFEARELRDCREALRREAEQIVDSLLLTEAQAAIRDSLNTKLPFRPETPPPIPPVDSSKVEPLFGPDDTLNNQK